MTEKNSIWKDIPPAFKIIGLISLLFLFIPPTIYCINFCTSLFDLSSEQSVWGTFGDFIGGTINPVFGYFGFLAILITIAIQRIDLIETRKEAKENSEYLKDQKTTLNIQKFEITFFNMLNQISNLLDSYSIGNVTGSDHFNKEIKKMVDGIDNTSDVNTIDKYINDNTIEDNFGNFVNHVSNIVNIIITSKDLVSDIQRELYIDILDGFLSLRHRYFLEMCYRSSYFKKQKEILKRLFKY